MAFDVKLAFLRELGSGYKQARESMEELLRDPSHEPALRQVWDFFHRIAGVAYVAGLPLLGHLAGVCERAAEVALEGNPEVRVKVIQSLSDGLGGVAVVLDKHGLVTNESMRPRRPKIAGLTQPGVSVDERVLSKVMIIDDDPVSAAVIDNALRMSGFMSSYCCDPTRALATLLAELPDLIILDVVMPTVDGFELCRRVREHPAMKLTPIIFVTRKGAVEERIRGLEVGGNDYIAKPFEPSELVARVRSHLQRYAALREMAIRDGLTRCYNHKYFKERLEQEIARARRYDSPFTLGLLDIDNFRRINDSHGHAAGDVILVSVSNVIMAGLRSTDVVARYGGEEFALLLVEAGVEEASIIAARMREQIATQAFTIGGDVPDEAQRSAVNVNVTVSIGMAQLGDKDNMDTLVKRADTALERAKRSGRNQVVAELV
jgi:diguanylate cyclase (GGDEF)-like protein